MARKPAAKKIAAGRDSAEAVLEAALALGEELGWDRLRLRDVSARAGVPLAELLDSYRDIDAVADAWFRRAWKAVLAPPPKGFAELPASERLHLVTMRWFDALASHRGLTGEMLSAKLYPSHPHHWVPMAFNLSRTIHWLRDAAMLDAGGRRRQMEEIGLTALFLATLARWLRDESEDQATTRDFLRRRLERADAVMARLWGRRPPPGAAAA